uniref:Sodium voltage-gated channel beta subunit 4 n=1 Tax=Sphenodon punctatus TaxID=8508 RepID=A0A8D0GGB3_SPHPU
MRQAGQERGCRIHGNLHWDWTCLRTNTLSLSWAGFRLCSVALALEVTVGKTNVVTALNGTDVLLPCTFTTCIGFENALFWWFYNGTKWLIKYTKKTTNPILTFSHPRVELPELTLGKENNISILLLSVDFSDSGQYFCKVKNPKEMNAQHNATLILNVVHELVKVDNTLTIIIVSAVGGFFGFLILVLLIKKCVLFIIKKTQEKKKECLVSSSGNDNTENGLAGSKAEQKSAPKA